MNLLNSLPKPKKTRLFPNNLPKLKLLSSVDIIVPPYGSRLNYIPRKKSDYCDGGAFPEVHIKQYPLEMGRKSQNNENTLQLRIDKKGKVNYDVVVRGGVRQNKNVFSTSKESEGISFKEEDLARPTNEENQKLLEKVRANLEEKLNGHLFSTHPAVYQQNKNIIKPIFVKYTPANQNRQLNSGASSRIIKIHQIPIDPLEPPKFRHKKLPSKPPSPPVPIMHSPPRTITYEDQKNWKIPPCVSNWKNNKGFVIPLHQRLATTGRGLIDTPINDRFASMAEALYLAERLAREQVESRAMERRRRTEQMRKEREKKLRKIAEETQEGLYETKSEDIKTTIVEREINNLNKEGEQKQFIGTPGIDNIGESGASREDIEAQNEREHLRTEARRQRKRQMGLEKAKGTRIPQERDISEQIALGQRISNNSGEAMFDQRLFNRDSGISSNLGSEDSYNIYDKPLNIARDQHIYRPKKLDIFDEDTELEELMKGGTKFKPHQRFQGTDEIKSSNDGPVQFEKIKPNEIPDPFNLEGLNEIKTNLMCNEKYSKLEIKSKKSSMKNKRNNLKRKRNSSKCLDSKNYNKK